MDLLLVDTIISWGLFALALFCIFALSAVIQKDLIYRRRRKHGAKSAQRVLLKAPSPSRSDEHRNIPQPLVRGYDSPELLHEDSALREANKTKYPSQSDTAILLVESPNPASEHHESRLSMILAQRVGGRCDN